MYGLIADIGATNARFALVDDNGTIRNTEILQCAEFSGFSEAVLAYLEKTKPEKKPRTASLALAAPLDRGDLVSMTNHTWSFSISDTKRRLNLEKFTVINDFTAVAYGVPLLEEKNRQKIGNGSVIENAPVGIIGPGTGLGVSAIVWHENKPIPITTEGGHVTMHAVNDREFSIIKHLMKTKYRHVSAERLVSGKGLVNLYNAIAALDGIAVPPRDGAQISEAAMDGSCKTCEEALDHFCAMLGSLAGNLALALGAFGGIYIAGGIVPKLGDYFIESDFRKRFLAKGRYSDYLDRIPTFVIHHPYIAFLGLKSLL